MKGGSESPPGRVSIASVWIGGVWIGRRRVEQRVDMEKRVYRAKQGRRRKMVAVVVAGLLVVAVGGGAAAVLLRSHASSPTSVAPLARSQVATIAARHSTSPSGGEVGLAVLRVRPDLETAALAPSEEIRLSLSRAVADVFGTALPTIVPTVSGAVVPTGHWTEPNSDSLVFQPSGVAFWPGDSYTLELPAPVAVVEGSVEVSASTETVTMQSAGWSMLRLQQMLAMLDYLPVSWTPANRAGSPTTTVGQVDLADAPPAGSFSWRWPMPATLESQWTPGSYSVVTKGALMAFEHVEGLDDSPARSNQLLWPYLIKAVLQGQRDPHPYVWIDVTKTLPETLNLWSNGRVIITSVANTGIPQDPTENGTFPVYLRFRQNYMSGHNPNGTYYHDLVHWIAYFNGSDAVHGFPRYSYGFPQSLGCVELPVAGPDPVSEQVWGYDHIGTLVTVQN